MDKNGDTKHLIMMPDVTLYISIYPLVYQWSVWNTWQTLVSINSCHSVNRKTEWQLVTVHRVQRMLISCMKWAFRRCLDVIKLSFSQRPQLWLISSIPVTFYCLQYTCNESVADWIWGEKKLWHMVKRLRLFFFLNSWFINYFRRYVYNIYNKIKRAVRRSWFL